MALLARVFRNCLGVPFTRKDRLLKMIKSPVAVEPSEDSDDGLRTQGPPGDPLATQPAGIRQIFDNIPSSYFFDLANKDKPRVAQPSYMCFPHGTQTWHIFNAQTIPLGRMANKIAYFIQGRNQPIYDHDHITPKEFGNFVVVVNGRNPMLIGAKGKEKLYRSHSRYPGHLKELTIRQVIERHH